LIFTFAQFSEPPIDSLCQVKPLWNSQTIKKFIVMVLGTCVVFSPRGERSAIPPTTITINGEQDGFLVVFTIKQVFLHTSADPVEIRYIVPNNSKLCLYGTTFRIGDRVITVSLQEKATAKETYVEAVSEGRAAILGKSLGNGLVEFTLGNVPPGERCEVEVKCALTASSSGLASTFFKFPLDACTPSGSVSCVTTNLTGPFAFTMRNLQPASVSSISANVPSTFDSASGTFTITDKPSVSALIVTTVHRAPLETECVSSGGYFALTHFTAELPGSERENNEFVFVVDCSGSMGGRRIAQARECLQIFIRSLAPNSFFNLVRFGSTFEKLFPAAVRYDAESARRALDTANALRADLGCTEIYEPLSAVFGEGRKGAGVRQVFVITDGEVDNTDRVIELARNHAGANRCFAIGLGSGADAGLVQGIADATGGRADFVADGADLTTTVIAQLEASLRPVVAGVSIEVAGVDGVELSPFPVPALSAAIAQTVFGTAAGRLGEIQVLVSGDFAGERFDTAVTSRESGLPEGVVGALFAYETIKALEAQAGRGGAIRTKVIKLSIAGGVLCSHTAFVGFSNEIFRVRPLPFGHRLSDDDDADCDYAPMLCCDASFEDDDDEPMMCFAAADSGSYGYRASDDDDHAPMMCCASPPAPACAAPAGAACAAPAPPTRPAGAAASTGDPLLALLDLQGFDGSWADAHALERLAGVTVECPDDLSGRGAVFATALAIALLRKQFEAKESVWRLIERKGLRWLAQQGVDAEAIVSTLITLL
jgi:hypothetical protein